MGNSVAFTYRRFCIFIFRYQIGTFLTKFSTTPQRKKSFNTFASKLSQMKMLPSVFSFLLFIIIIALPPALLQYTCNTGLLASNFWVTFIFMSSLTFLVVIGMLAAKQKDQEYFTPAFLGGTTIKLLACLIFIFVFVNRNTINKHVFLADFIYIYLLNTAFEVYILLLNLRHKNLR